MNSHESIADHINQTVASGGRVTFKVTLCGYEGDLILALQLIDSLQLQCAAAMTTWWRANSNQYSHLSAYNQRSERRTFIRGFASTAEDRVEDMYMAEVETATATNPGTELVLLDRSRAVDVKYASMFPNLGSARGRQSQGGYASRSAGQAAGSRADVGSHASAVGGGRAAIGK